MNDTQRRWLIGLLLVGVVFSLLGSGAVLSQRQMRLRGTLNGFPQVDAPVRLPMLGVNADLTQYDTSALDENLGLIAAGGFTWVRQPFMWGEIEASQGQYDWADYDAVVEAAAEHEVELVVVIEGLPAWEEGEPSDHLGALEAFAGSLAERYGEQIDVYQIWDEPNLASGWNGHAANPVGYAAMLEAAYGAIHEADADSIVITAGLAPTIETGPDNVSDVLYLQALYDNGAGPFFDGVAGKPYGFDSGPDDLKVDANLLNFSRMVLLREVMEAAGDGHKLLWASHFGWNSLPDGWTGEASAWGQTTPDQQASQTVAAYERALTEWYWVGPMILDNWQPSGRANDARWGFALRGQDGTLSETYEAIQKRAETFNGVMWPGRYGPETPLADYSGEWEFSELGADFSEAGESVVDVPFRGNSLAVVIRRDNYRAYLYVDVDGEPSGMLPRDDRGAYLVLTSPDYQPQIDVMPVARGLDNGITHGAHLEAERGWDQWALVGFAVGNHVNTMGYDAALVGLGLLAVGLAVLVVWQSRQLETSGSLKQVVDWMRTGVSRTVHVGLSLASALAFWLAAALTWGGLLPNVLRRIGDGPSLVVTALTAGVFYYSPWLILTLVALVMLFLLIYARPQIGVALMIFFSPYWLHPRPLYERLFSMVEVMSLLTLAAWAIHVVADRREKGWSTIRQVWNEMTALDKAVGGFVLLSGAALMWSARLDIAITDLRQMAIEPTVVYLVLRTLPFSKTERWQIVDLWVLTGSVVAAIGLYQFVTGADIITAEGGITRLRSVFNSPNSVALFLGRVIPVCMAVVLIGGEKWRRWAYSVGGAMMVGAFVLSLSKGGLLLGLPAGAAMVIILWGGKWGLIAVIAGVVLEGLALIPLSRIPRFQGLFDISSPTSTSFYRVRLWQSTLRMIGDRPLTGIGLDQFLYEYRGHYILPEAWQEPNLGAPHNFILSYWVRLGVLGAVIGVWIQVIFWRTGLRLHRMLNGHERSTRALVVGLMGGMAAAVAHGMVDEAYYLIDLAFVFFMMIGLIQQIHLEDAA